MTGRAAASFVPHDQPGHAHDDRVQSFDPAEARALLAASRYGPPVDGRIGGVDLAFMFVPNARSTARVKWATDNWLGHLAVTVMPDPVINYGYGPLIKRPQALPQLSLMGWCADYPDAQDWYGSVFHSRSRNRSGFANTVFDAIVDKADRERDPTAREALYQGASYVLSRSAPAAYLTWSENWTLARPDVRGYGTSAFDWDFAQFSLSTIYRARK
jgi:oligopeptide transport system substrate-binding protein